MKRIKLKAYSQAARKHGIYRRSFKIALLVGTLLNLINQPQLLLGLCLNNFNAIKDIKLFEGVIDVHDALFYVAIW